MTRLALAALCSLIALSGAVAAQTNSRLSISSNTAILRGLDKVTGQARDFEAPVGKAVKFGTLEITVRACRKAPSEETPETAVYFEVIDRPLQKIDETVAPEPVQLKSGWVFASSPAVNALEHPVYDVWAITCKT